MLYLLDANTIIEASTKYYQMNRVKPFWEWLLYHAENGRIKIPQEIYEEVLKGKKDEFVKWFEQKETRLSLELNEEVNIDKLRKIVEEGYGLDLTEVQIEKMGRDPFLIAYALGVNGRCIVTQEIPGQKKRQNQKIPDVCNNFKIQSCNIFKVIEDLDFSIDWKNKSV